MKNSRLYLIVALLTISISAVASFKGIKKVIVGYYYKKGAACVYINQTIPCNPSSVPDCIYLDPATLMVYPCFLDPLCTTPLGRDD